MDFGFRMKRNLETVCVLPVSQVLFVFPLHLPMVPTETDYKRL